TVGKHHKGWLTKEAGFTEAGTTFDVFDVKGTKMGMLICADGTKEANLQAIADKGARLLYAPHAKTTGGARAGGCRLRRPVGRPRRLDREAQADGGAAQPRGDRGAGVEGPTGEGPGGRRLGERGVVHRPRRQDAGADADLDEEGGQQGVRADLQRAAGREVTLL